MNEDHYPTTSTFGYFPGLPVFHSRDRVNWTQIASAINRASRLDLGTGDMTRGDRAA